MTFSRLVGLPLAVLVLHLGFVATESQCRAGDDTPPSHEHHDAASHAQPESPHHEQGPAIPVCCQALGSCSATVLLAGVVQAMPRLVDGSRQIPFHPLGHPTLSAAPEAPPPKA